MAATKNGVGELARAWALARHASEALALDVPTQALEALVLRGDVLGVVVAELERQRAGARDAQESTDPNAGERQRAHGFAAGVLDAMVTA